MENILVFVAHNDDQIIGMGGTIANYIKEGKRIIVVLFSYGERSNPLIKPDVLKELRIKEALKVDKLLGIKKTIFLGLPDGKIKRHINDKGIHNIIKDM